MSDESGNHNGIPDHWRDPQTYAEDFYAGDDVRPSGDLRDASRLATEDVIDLEDGDDDHAEETDNEIQPLSQDTCKYSFSLIIILYLLNLHCSVSS